MDFPDWVTGPTIVAVRSFSIVLPAIAGHRSRKIVAQFPQRPTVTLRHKESGRLHTGWADGVIEDQFEIAPTPIEEN